MAKKEFGWGDIKEFSQKSDSPKEQNLYLKLEPGKKYRIRLYGTPKYRYIGWYDKKKYIVSEELLEEFERHTKVKPKLTYVVNIIDREDTKNNIARFKILEKGSSIFQSMKTYFDETGVEPGGKKAPDFLIKAIPGKDARSTRYEVFPLPGENTFSEKEQEVIDRAKKMDPDDLKRLPLGERGPVDIDASPLYSEDIWEKKVKDLLDGKLNSSEDIKNVSRELDDEDEPEVEEEVEVVVETVKKKTTGTKKAPKSIDELLEDYEE